MKRLSTIGILAAIGLASSAHGQACASYPNALANGTTADATQVMANFNCAALLGGAHFTGPVDLGGVEKVSLNGGSLGFNRRVQDGLIYNTSAYAYQFQHYDGTTATADVLGLQVYTPSGGGVSNLALTANGAGSIGIAGVPSATYTFYVSGTAAGASAWANASDARLKTNVREITGALDLIGRLRGVRFDWLPPGERSVGRSLNLAVSRPQVGLIAQEVEAVVPEAVTAPVKGSNDIYTLREGDLVPVLIEAVKEQQAEISAMRAELAALKASR